MVPISRLFLLTLAILLSAAGTAHAQAAERVRVDWLDGLWEYGTLRYLSDAEVSIAVAPESAGGEPREIVANTSEVARVFWRRRGSSTGNHAMQILRDGSRYRAQLQELTDTEAIFQARWYGPPGSREVLRVPLEQVKFVGLQPPAVKPAIDDAAVQRLIDEEVPEDDAVIMAGNAQVAVIRCIVLAVTDRHVKLYWKDEEFTLDREKVWGIRLAALPDSEPRQDGTGFMLIGARKDERLYGVSFLRQPGTMEFMVNRPGEVRWVVSHGYVAEIVYASQRSLDLTSLEPVAFESETLLGRKWAIRFGESVRGLPLRIGVEEFADGIGCHAPARITYDLPGGFQRFAVTVGVDAAAPGSGSVIFRVLDGDGNELARSPLMTAGAKHKQLVANLNGARRIVLVADSADKLDVGDHANWCDPRLIRGQ